MRLGIHTVSRIGVCTWVALLLPGELSCGEHAIEMSASEMALVESGEIVVRELPGRTGSEQCYEAVGVIDANLDDIYGILIDFENYHEFMPNVTSIEVLEKTPSSALTNWLLTLPLGKTKRYRLRLAFTADAGEAFIEWRKVDWPELLPEETIVDTAGHWILHSSGDGAALALYRLCTDPGHVPLGLGWIVDALSKNSIPKTIINTRSRLRKLKSG